MNVYKCPTCKQESKIVNGCGCDPNNMPTECELTELFYRVRGQRNKLLWACQKALRAYDAAHAEGGSSWSGRDVDEMRQAVAECY